MPRRILLYFGSFNPVHIGHLLIAQEALTRTKADELWFVVSPRNPMKNSVELADEEHRKKMLELAIGNYALERMSVCDIEFGLPRPSYTVDTLRALSDRYPDIRFGMLIGEDNLRQFNRWKEYEEILNRVRVFAYARGSVRYGEVSDSVLAHRNLQCWGDVPLLDISSSRVRHKIMNSEPYEVYLPFGVATYIKEYGLYRTVTA